MLGATPTGAPGPNHAAGPAAYASPNWMYTTPPPGFHSQQGAHIRAPLPTMPLQQLGYPFIQPSGNKLPSSAQPSKCELDMTPEDFRSWKTTLSMWIALSRVSNQESVILIRMFCTPQLQKALDNRIACEEWARLMPAEGMDLLEGITVKYTSRAADIGAFYSLKQGPYENIGAYFTRGHEVASNAKLHCPGCSQSLGNYLLLSRLAIGIHSEELRREVFRAFDNLNNVDQLRAFCIVHEAASKAASGGAQHN